MRLSFRSELCRMVSRRAQVSSYIQAWWFRSSQTDLWKDKYSQALFRREVAQTNTAAGRDLPSVWATPFCLLVQMWVLFPRHIWMLVPGFSAQERRLVLENQQCGQCQQPSRMLTATSEKLYTLTCTEICQRSQCLWLQRESGKRKAKYFFRESQGNSRDYMCLYTYLQKKMTYSVWQLPCSCPSYIS